MPDSSIRLVCFDLGGVIVRTCATWREACLRAGLPAHVQAETPEAEARIRAADDRHAIGRMTTEAFFREVEAATAGVYTIPELMRLHDAWLLGEYDGLREIILELNGQIRTACLSNTNPPHWDLMVRDGRPAETAPVPTPFPRAAFPAFQLLQQREASHLLGLAKPAAEIYAAFEQRSGCHGPEILFFDDREENVAAARAAGWRAEVVRADFEPAEQIRNALRGYGALD